MHYNDEVLTFVLLGVRTASSRLHNHIECELHNKTQHHDMSRVPFSACLCEGGSRLSCDMR